MIKARARELGLLFSGIPGTNNSITDIDGILVGYKTKTSAEGSAINTGVTAILPRGNDTIPKPVWAGMYALNGNGEMTGTHWINDGGYFVGPVMITNSHSVGIVHHAAVKWMIQNYHDAWKKNHLWAMPVVAETYDGILNDINGMHVTEFDALEALKTADGGRIAEGNVGGGTGMIAYDFKGGTGTSSREVIIDDVKYTVASLVQANHGVRSWFNVLGAPVGKHMTDDCIHDSHEQGSIIVILATDAPMLPHQLRRLAKRAAIGIGRGGTPGGNNSGDIFLAFSTANEMDLPQLSDAKKSIEYLNDEVFDQIYLGAVECVEEAVINAMVAAKDMPTFKPKGKICRAIDINKLKQITKKYGVS